MANELNINLSSITFLKGIYNDKVTPGAIPITVAGTHAAKDTIGLTTTDSVINKGNIGTIGFFYLKNNDPNNDVLIGSDGTNYPLKVPAGKVAIGFWNAAAMHAKAAAGTPTLDYWLIEL